MDYFPNGQNHQQWAFADQQQPPQQQPNDWSAAHPSSSPDAADLAVLAALDPTSALPPPRGCNHSYP